jgi:hypothetical protein
MESKARKRVTFLQSAYAVIDVDREIEIDVPANIDTDNLSEEQMSTIIEFAIEAGLISEEQASWQSDGDFSLVDEEVIMTEIVEVASGDGSNLKKQTEANRLSLNDVKGRRPQMEGEQLMGCAGNWELVRNHDGRGVSLHLLSHGCWHGTPKFPAEELTMLKECVDSALLQIKKDALISR